MTVDSDEIPEFLEVPEINFVNGECFVLLENKNNNDIDFIGDTGATEHIMK